jgi:hypothetical protein
MPVTFKVGFDFIGALLAQAERIFNRQVFDIGPGAVKQDNTDRSNTD